MTKVVRKLTGEQRRTAIIQAARKVFVEKGFHGTTSRELAKAAGVSEALLFKHFPSKKALYSAILMFCCKQEGAKALERIESLDPSTSSLVYMVWDFVSHILGSQPNEEDRIFFRLILRSVMDEGEFTRVALEGLPIRWAQKLEECFEAAKRAGDLVERPLAPPLVGWVVHHLISGFIMHLFPKRPLIGYQVPREELVKQVVWFCLRGMGVKEETIGASLKEFQIGPL